ncbi:YlbF family regulator [Streptococcus ferus]|uniref:YlbF family regulator n=1 Tax=Streptococcus ferus TaxID=1345 RepID=UPI0035A02226
MTAFEETLDQLCQLLAQHESIRAYQAIETKVQQLPDLQDQIHRMKAYQQDAVLFEKIEKSQAYQAADEKAARIQEDIENQPIVEDYRAKLQDASDLLTYVTKRLEEGINEELNHGK